MDIRPANKVNKDFFPIVSLLFVFCAFLIAIYCFATQEVLNNDYFSKDRDEHLLSTVEAYHLTSSFPDLYKAKEYGYAIGDMQFILRYFPNHPKALLLLCHVARLLKRPFLPIPYFNKAISLYPQYAITHIQYGEYLIRVDQIDIGIQQLNIGIRLDPKSGIAHALLAEAYNKKGNTELSKQEMQKARDLGFKDSLEEVINPIEKDP